jgi:predicted phosphohydrolase
MNVWAIADLHLSFARPERRERFAARWKDHAAKIEGLWTETVQPGDLVLLPGDLSMARNHRDLQPDLAWIGSLPGIKVLSPGNHDGWWNDIGQVRGMLRESMHAVQGDALHLAGAIVSGARGFPPLTEERTPEQQLELDRGLRELETALNEAERLRAGTSTPVYLLWHYPPFDRYGQPGPLVAWLERAAVSACVYGHLHTEGQWSRTVQGSLRGVRYYCVAADAIGFRPLRIDSW